MAQDDGGAMFPRIESIYGRQLVAAAEGISLREYAEIHFTAAWITALGGHVFREAQASGEYEDVAEFRRYAQSMGATQADAMIAARKEAEDNG